MKPFIYINIHSHSEMANLIMVDNVIEVLTITTSI